jgi:peptidoglycan/xylan/chitin deacetylase (PgdA/CDA1 family)
MQKHRNGSTGSYADEPAMASVHAERRRAVSPLRRLATRALRVPVINDAARRIAAVRGRSLALVYHRVAPDGSRPSWLVPSLPEALFRRQLQALGELGEIVPVTELAAPHDRQRRNRFALTFDDDYQTHADHVLPVLTALGVHGTFFLSGRSLHGLGPYWFEVLEWLINAHGLDDVAGRLGLDSQSPIELALACERDPQRQVLLEQTAEQPPAHLRRDQIQALAATMTIGFHTLHHRALPVLPDDALARALTEGRHDLTAVAGRPLRLFAYPHGKGDHRVAARVRAAGYTAAWTGLPNAIRSSDDRFLLGRWEPGSLEVDDFLVKLAVRLLRSPPRAPAEAGGKGW